jgi:hypothetical protein
MMRQVTTKPSVTFRLIFIAFHDDHAVTSYQKGDEVDVLAKTLG